MQHFLDLFTPETWGKYQSTDQTVTGFRVRQRRIATERVKEGDLLLCYLTRISRWCGVLEITSEAYEDDRPIFNDPDPFVVRFKVKPLVVLDVELSIPIREDAVWNGLTITNKHEKDYRYWSGPFRSSLYQFADQDGRLLVELLQDQHESRRNYPLSRSEVKKLAVTKVHSPAGRWKSRFLRSKTRPTPRRKRQQPPLRMMSGSRFGYKQVWRRSAPRWALRFGYQTRIVL